jgi:hypothetical protein
MIFQAAAAMPQLQLDAAQGRREWPRRVILVTIIGPAERFAPVPAFDDRVSSLLHRRNGGKDNLQIRSQIDSQTNSGRKFPAQIPGINPQDKSSGARPTRLAARHRNCDIPAHRRMGALLEPVCSGSRRDLLGFCAIFAVTLRRQEAAYQRREQDRGGNPACEYDRN